MLSESIKSRTRSHHEQIEASPAMQVVVSPDLSREAYLQHLLRLHGFYRGFERVAASIDGLSEWLPDLDQRMVKTGMIEEDLRSLGAPLPSEDEPQDLGLETVADALGALYVIEGSTLGGRIIGRMLGQSLGVTQEAGAAFYHSYGDDRGPKWAAYKDALDRFGDANPDDAEAVIASASSTFDAMERWMAGTVA